MSLLVERLKDPDLFVQKSMIAGEWLNQASNGKTFEVTNPSTGEVIAVLPDLGAPELEHAICAANRAQKAWAQFSAKDRSSALHRLYELMVENADDLATILTSEMGKPLAEAKGEVLYGASYFEWFGEEAKRAYGDIIPGHQSDKRLMVIHQPIGVVGTITPWNFPNAMLCRKLAPALAAGCSVIAKPAAQTPLSALAIAVLAERAGLAMELFSVVTTTNSSLVGATFCDDERIRKISFTGSTNVGRWLMERAAGQIKKLGLELGGNAPFIVFDDADLDAAVEGTMQSKFRNAGQTCVCANRIYVQSGIYEQYAAALSRKVSELVIGDGFEPSVTLGPLIESRAGDKVREHIEDALAKGATLAVGGEAHPKGGNFFTPTVLTNVSQDMRVAKEETFGPLAPLFRFETEEEVVRLANDTEFGLAAYLFTQKIQRCFHLSEALEYGMVGVNTGLISTEVAPFGGIKQSGLGREGARQGLLDYMEMKYICLGV